MLARLLRFRADMRYPCFKLAFVCAAILCYLLPDSAQAQVSTASLQGNINDGSNAAVSRAQVTVENTATGVEMRFVSNDAGVFLAPSLQPGNYSLRIGKEGFSEVVIDNITLNVGDQKLIQIRLKVASAHESITVDAGGLTLNTTNASVSTVIDRKFVQNIPLNGRSFQDLISMTPGVVTQSPQASSVLGYSGDFSVNGQRTQSNYYQIDGVSGNIGAGNGTGAPQAANSGSLPSTTALGTTQSLISVDALQEFRVQSSTYSAEYGRTPGGQFSLVTRSGTNIPHGSAYDYLRNDFFDANDWFNSHSNKPKTALRQNDFGGTFGDPIRVPGFYDGRNRSFFFVSYEGLRLRLPQAASVQYVPDTCLRQEAPIALQSILNAYPQPNGLDYGTCSATVKDPSLAQFIQPYSLPSKIDSTNARLDQTVSARLSAFFRAAYTPTSATTRSLSTVGQALFNTQAYTLGVNAELASNTTDEFRIGYSKSSSAQTVNLDSFGGATPLDLAGAMGISAYPTAAPEIYLSFTGIGTSVLRTSNTRNQQMQWNVVDTASFARGHHLVRLGIDYRHIISPLTPLAASANANFLSGASILNDSANSVVVQKFTAATPVFNETALFVQDEYQVLPRLNLALGLRWEVDPSPIERNGNDAYTVLGNIDVPSSLVLAPQGTPLWQTSWYNFAPRLGVAWTAYTAPDWETVIRAGGGVFYDTNNEVATNGYDALGFRAFKVLANAPVPLSTNQLNFSTAPTIPYTTVYAFPSHLQLPYTLQWNGSLEQALGKQQALTVSYVASTGRRLTQIQERSVSSLNPSFTTVLYAQGGVTSNYQSLQLKFQRSVAQGLQSLASYTWSHALDYGSNSSALPLTRGNSDFDVRHNLEGGLSYEIPGAKRNRALRVITQEWAVDGRLMARTAFPITLEGSLVTDPATGYLYYGNVDLIAGRSLYLHGAQYPGGRALNGGPNTTSATAAIVSAGTTTGNAPRNFVRGFDAVQMNTALRRNVHLYERLSMQFRAEAFNILNHPNFGYVDPTLTDLTFGTATKMLDSSLGTVAAQYQQGGPRSLQFALKVQF